ncbi:hypothetical protein CBL_11823 [Carabus blaptoides fortunei]
MRWVRDFHKQYALSPTTVIIHYFTRKTRQAQVNAILCTVLITAGRSDCIYI